MDFVLDEDVIDLTAIDANTGSPSFNDAFTFIGTAAFTGAAQVRYFVGGSGNTGVQLNVNGDPSADASFVVQGAFDLLDIDFLL